MLALAASEVAAELQEEVEVFEMLGVDLLAL